MKPEPQKGTKRFPYGAVRIPVMKGRNGNIIESNLLVSGLEMDWRSFAGWSCSWTEADAEAEAATGEVKGMQFKSAESICRKKDARVPKHAALYIAECAKSR